ncbi:hypothetical protein D1872_269370 [compost metagenome]
MAGSAISVEAFAARFLKPRLALLDLPEQEQHELIDLPFFLERHHPADMRQFLEYPQRVAAEIHQVEVRLIRRVSLGDRHAQRFEKHGFSRSRRAVDEQIAFPRKIDLQHVLALIPRIVHPPDRHRE